MLAFAEVLVSDSIQVGHVEEQVRTISGFNESETLVRQTLDRTFRHYYLLLKKLLLRPVEAALFGQ